MLLAGTSATIEVKLAYAKTTNHLPIVASYVDNDSTNGTYAAGTNALNSNNVTAVTAVASPSSGIQRVVKSLHVYNDDTVSAMVTVTYFDGSTRYDLMRTVLLPKDTLVFSSELGWYAIDTNGAMRSHVQSNSYLPPVRRPVGQIARAATNSKTLTSTSTFAVYLGRADRDFTSVKVLWVCNTAATGITWAELAMATGAFVLGGNASLTTLGTALNIAAVINSTGIKTSTVTATGKPMDDLWLLIGNQATGAGAIQSALANTNQNGWQQAATARPSTMGAATGFTVEGTAVVPGYYAYQLL